MKISFIGAGNMAEAILGGLLESGLVSKDEVQLADVSAERLSALSGRYGVGTSESNPDAVFGAEVIFLSVKPQTLDGVLQELGTSLGPDQLVISIAAGLTTAWLDERLPAGPRILRVMPNTPALVKEGMSCIAEGPRSTPEDIDLAQKIFAAVGVVAVVTEDQMDAVTAVSGSGPAYAFYLMEHMETAARDLGLTAQQARVLVTQTLKGAALLCQAAESEGPDVLRQRVTSKGGTTEAALRILDEAGVGEVIADAVRAAAARSNELSGR